MRCNLDDVHFFFLRTVIKTMPRLRKGHFGHFKGKIMFAITPYIAEREAGKEWKSCRVIGIEASESHLAPRFVVEYKEGGVTYLSFEEGIRKLEPGNPL